MGKPKKKQSPVDEFKELVAGGMKPSEVVSKRPDLAPALDEIIEVENPRSGNARGSGPTMEGHPTISLDDPKVPATW